MKLQANELHFPCRCNYKIIFNSIIYRLKESLQEIFFIFNSNCVKNGQARSRTWGVWHGLTCQRSKWFNYRGSFWSTQFTQLELIKTNSIVKISLTNIWLRKNIYILYTWRYFSDNFSSLTLVYVNVITSHEVLKAHRNSMRILYVMPTTLRITKSLALCCMDMNGSHF